MPPRLAGAGVSKRELRDDDLAWLRHLYATTREVELRSLPWPDEVKRAFLDSQFELQHRHFIGHFSTSSFSAIVDASGTSLGRYYLLREATRHLLVDISLFPEYRGAGIGSALIRHSQEQAAAADCPLYLHVQHQNTDARRLYDRLGFTAIDAGSSHAKMRWRG